jgi:NitT/TauT family transport system substrate-binding protein
MTAVARVLSLLSAVALAACAPAPREPIRLGLLVFPPYELFYLAAESGELPRETARLVSYRSPAELARAYESGVLDAMAATLEYGLALHRGNEGHRVVLILDVSHGADALIARPPLASLAELRGRRVGAESGELGSYVLQRALDSAGLRHDEIEIVAVDMGDQEEAYLAGRVDGLVTYDPVRARLVAAGARELFTSREIPGEIVDVLIVRDELLANRRDDLRRIVAAWFASRASFLADPRAAAERIAPREALTADQLLATLAGVRLPDAAENAALLSGRDPALVDSVRRREDRLVAAGIVDRLPPLDRLFDPSLLSEPSP